MKQPKLQRHQPRFAVAMASLTIVIMAASCSSSDDARDSATATFDGETCVYDGPTEFELNTEATFTVSNTSTRLDVGFSLWKVPDGTTVEDIENAPEGIFSIAPDETSDLMRAARFQGENLPGEEYDMIVPLDTAGTWLLNCWNPDIERPATSFEVKG